MRRPWLNLVGNQLVWLCAVAGAGRGLQWPALLGAALYIGSQLSSSLHVRVDLRLILLALACAWLVDASAAASGTVRYAAAPLGWAPPPWILALWAAFAMTLTSSMRFLQRHAALEGRADAAVLLDAHVAGGHALHAAILVIQDFRRSEAGEDFDAQPFGLFRQPAAQIAQRPGIGALIVHPARRHDVRHRHLAGFGQEPVLIVCHRRFRHRAAHVAPFREKLVQRTGIDHGARQDMGADFRPLFQHAHRQFLTSRIGQLLQSDRGGQSGRAAPHDHDVIGHRIPFAHNPSITGVGGGTPLSDRLNTPTFYHEMR